MERITIAIDGPASSGKSTIAKEVAKKLNITHIDSGSMYRAAAYYVLKEGIDPEDEYEVCASVDNIEIKFDIKDGKKIIFLNGENVEKEIRTNEVSKVASIVSSYKKLREKLVNLQKEMGNKESVVMDGRDIGTVVFKNADLKIFLLCDVEERARRRYNELKKKEDNLNFKSVLSELKERDFRDINRKNSPLKKADDALEIDSTNMSIDDLLEYILKLVKSVKNKEYVK